MSEEKIEARAMINNAQNVEQIRNIIFGTHIKEFDKKLSQLDTKINTIEKNLTQMLKESHLKLKGDSEHSFMLIEEAIKELNENIQRECLQEKEQVNRRDIQLHKEKREKETFYSLCI
jgi:hypothetical protein